MSKQFKRVREWLEPPGSFGPGPRNAISDVAGVEIGHLTLSEGDDVRTGVTVLRPHAGDPYLLRCPAAVAVGNGYGKLTGALQVQELGEIETLVGLTNTLSVPQVWQGLLDYHLETTRPAPGSLNVLVGETNDGHLNDIRACRVRPEHVRAAIAALGPEVGEGAVGAGTGTCCFGYKGGIGTASRLVPHGAAGTYAVGALVQSNYGGHLTLYGLRLPNGPQEAAGRPGAGAGSCMILLACDAPLDARQLGRCARRAILGLAYTGSFLAHGSGDFCLAFSNYAPNLRPADGCEERGARRVEVLPDEQLSPFFEATIECVAEAVYNSLTMAPDMSGYMGHSAQGLDLGRYLTAP